MNELAENMVAINVKRLQFYYALLPILPPAEL
jgi:hypothetical protein